MTDEFLPMVGFGPVKRWSKREVASMLAGIQDIQDGDGTGCVYFTLSVFTVLTAFL